MAHRFDKGNTGSIVTIVTSPPRLMVASANDFPKLQTTHRQKSFCHTPVPITNPTRSLTEAKKHARAPTSTPTRTNCRERCTLSRHMHDYIISIQRQRHPVNYYDACVHRYVHTRYCCCCCCCYGFLQRCRERILQTFCRRNVAPHCTKGAGGRPPYASEKALLSEWFLHQKALTGVLGSRKGGGDFLSLVWAFSFRENLSRPVLDGATV